MFDFLFHLNYINRKSYVKSIIIHDAKKKYNELYMNLYQILVDKFK